ncbi:MAG: 2-phospho-L-lactate transferase [Betaproteobacteria bacterium]|nr:2-phospho-L-lactate transferase [Betaproteobacteria bacterium]
MIVALAGGVGGARLAVGLAAVLPPERLTVVVNTGDDFEHVGLAICPDLDTVMYTLARLNNPELGWGRADETWSFMETLQALGGETWFRLGDRDLAVHVMRTAALARGERLSDITRTLTQRLGIAHAVVPMSDDPVRTVVVTHEGELPFQDYFVRRRCEPAVSGFRFEGASSAGAPDALRSIMGSRVDAVVVCPSNPFVSIAPMLGVAEIRDWLARRTFPVIAVSPIVGGEAVKGPAAKMMRELGVDASASGVARYYGSLVDAWVIDQRDAEAEPEIAALGKRVRVTDTLMTATAKSAALATAVLELASEVRRA